MHRARKLSKRTSLGREASPCGVVMKNVVSGGRLKSRVQKPVPLMKLCDLSFFTGEKGLLLLVVVVTRMIE